jgi:TP901 family phage tail tape measure protein
MDEINYGLQIYTDKADAAILTTHKKGRDLFEKKGFNLNLKGGSLPLGRITGDFDKFSGSLDAATARVLAFTATTTVVYGLATAFTRLFTDSVKLEKQLAGIQAILQTSNSNLQIFSSELFKVANATGQSFDVAAAAASEFARQGLSVEETLKATNAALAFSKIAGTDAAQTVENLTAAINTFTDEALTYEDVVDSIVSLDNAFAISAAGISDGLKRVGSVASAAGIELKEIASLISVVQQVSARGAPVISNGLKTIFTRLSRTSVQEVLNNIGIATENSNGEFKSQIEVLTNLSNKLDSLSDSQRAFVLEQVAGVYQINTLQATLKSLNGEYSLFDKAVRVASDSSGNAAERLKILTETTDANLQKLKNNLTQFLAETGKVTVQPILDSFVGIGNKILDTLNLGAAADGGEKAGLSIGKVILNGISSALAGPGAYLLIGIIGRLLFKISKDAFTAVQALSGLKKASLVDEKMQLSVNKAILMGNKGLVDRLATTTSLVEKTQILEELMMSMARRQGIAQVSEAVTVGLAANKRGKNKAKGYIPTYSNGFSPEVKMAEKKGALSSSYASGLVVNSPVGGVMNTAETASKIPSNNSKGFVPESKKKYFINPPPNSKGGKKHKEESIKKTGINPYEQEQFKVSSNGVLRSSGFIPNFVKTSREIGRGVEGSFHKLSEGVGVKRFYKNQSRREIQDKVTREYSISRLLSEGNLIPGVTGPQIPDTLDRSVRTSSIRKEIIKDPMAIKSIGRDASNGFGKILEGKMYDSGVLMSDLIGENYSVNAKGQDFLKKHLDYLSSRRAGASYDSDNQLYEDFVKAGGKAVIVDAGMAEARSKEAKEKINEYKRRSFSKGFIPNFAKASLERGKGIGKIKKKDISKYNKNDDGQLQSIEYSGKISGEQSSRVADVGIDTIKNLKYNVVSLNTPDYIKGIKKKLAGEFTEDKAKFITNIGLKNGYTEDGVKLLIDNLRNRGEVKDSSMPLIEGEKNDSIENQINGFAIKVGGNMFEKTGQRAFNEINKEASVLATGKGARMDIINSKRQGIAEVKAGEITRDNLVSKALQTKALELPKTDKRSKFPFFKNKIKEPISFEKPYTLIKRQENSTAALPSYFSSKGFIPNFAEITRRVGILDGDVLANPEYAQIVNSEMERLGNSKTHEYWEHLGNYAMQKRKTGGLKRITGIYGAPGSGKTSLAFNADKYGIPKKSDDSKFRKTTRIPILQESDIDKVDEVVATKASQSNAERSLQEGLFGGVDRLISLQISREDQIKSAKKRAASDNPIANQGRSGKSLLETVGKNPEDPNYIAAVAENKGVPVARLQREGDKTSIIKKQLNIEKKKIAFAYGAFAPFTEGHKEMFTQARSLGFEPENIVFGVSSGATLKEGDKNSYRTSVFHIGLRRQLIKKATGAKTTVIPSSEFRGRIPSVFKVSDGRYLSPTPGSIALVGDDKGLYETAKYTEKGLQVVQDARTEGISGTELRKAIGEGDTKGIRRLAAGGSEDLLIANLPQIQNRTAFIDKTMGRTSLKKNKAIDKINRRLGELPPKIYTVGKNITPPEQADEIRALRKQRKRIQESDSGSRILDRATRMYKALQTDDYVDDIIDEPINNPKSKSKKNVNLNSKIDESDDYIDISQFLPNNVNAANQFALAQSRGNKNVEFDDKISTISFEQVQVKIPDKGGSRRNLMSSILQSAPDSYRFKDKNRKDGKVDQTDYTGVFERYAIQQANKTKVGPKFIPTRNTGFNKGNNAVDAFSIDSIENKEISLLEAKAGDWTAPKVGDKYGRFLPENIAELSPMLLPLFTEGVPDKYDRIKLTNYIAVPDLNDIDPITRRQTNAGPLTQIVNGKRIVPKIVIPKLRFQGSTRARDLPNMGKEVGMTMNAYPERMSVPDSDMPAIETGPLSDDERKVQEWAANLAGQGSRARKTTNSYKKIQQQILTERQLPTDVQDRNMPVSEIAPLSDEDRVQAILSARYNKPRNTGGRKKTREQVLRENGLERFLSSGFIPNFASKLSYKETQNAKKKSRAKEAKAGIPIGKIRMGKNPSLRTPFNPEGFGTYNKYEGTLANGMGLAKKEGIDPRSKGMSASEGFIPNFALQSSFMGGGAEGTFHRLTKDIGVKRFYNRKPSSSAGIFAGFETKKDTKTANVKSESNLPKTITDEFTVSKLLAEKRLVDGITGPKIPDNLERALRAKSIRKEIIKEPMARDSVGIAASGVFGRILQARLKKAGLEMDDLHGANYTLNPQGRKFIEENKNNLLKDYVKYYKVPESSQDLYDKFVKSGGKATIIDAGYTNVIDPNLKNQVNEYSKKTNSRGFIPNFATPSLASDKTFFRDVVGNKKSGKNLARNIDRKTYDFLIAKYGREKVESSLAKISKTPAFDFSSEKDKMYKEAVEKNNTDLLKKMVEKEAQDSPYNRKGVRLGFYNKGVPLRSEIKDLNFGPGYYTAEDASLSIGGSDVSVNSKPHEDRLKALGLKASDVQFRKDEVYVKAQKPLTGNLPDEFMPYLNARVNYEIAINDAYAKLGKYGHLSPEEIAKISNRSLLLSTLRSRSAKNEKYKIGTAILMKEGKIPYDSIRGIAGRTLQEKTMSSELVVPNASQIKSAALVEYDDDGNLIPLSKRFDEKSDDIRGSKNPNKKRGRGYSIQGLGLRGKPTSFAKGFIPNFFSRLSPAKIPYAQERKALNESVNAEMSAGFERKDVKIGRRASLKTKSNPKGLAVFNKDEKTLSKGMSFAKMAKIEPTTKRTYGDSSSGLVSRTSAFGFIPNFEIPVRRPSLMNRVRQGASKVKTAANSPLALKIRSMLNTPTSTNALSLLISQIDGAPDISSDEIEFFKKVLDQVQYSTGNLLTSVQRANLPSLRTALSVIVPTVDDYLSSRFSRENPNSSSEGFIPNFATPKEKRALKKIRKRNEAKQKNADKDQEKKDKTQAAQQKVAAVRARPALPSSLRSGLGGSFQATREIFQRNQAKRKAAEAEKKASRTNAAPIKKAGISPQDQAKRDAKANADRKRRNIKIDYTNAKAQMAKLPQAPGRYQPTLTAQNQFVSRKEILKNLTQDRINKRRVGAKGVENTFKKGGQGQSKLFRNRDGQIVGSEERNRKADSIRADRLYNRSVAAGIMTPGGKLGSPILPTKGIQGAGKGMQSFPRTQIENRFQVEKDARKAKANRLRSVNNESRSIRKEYKADFAKQKELNANQKGGILQGGGQQGGGKQGAMPAGGGMPMGGDLPDSDNKVTKTPQELKQEKKEKRAAKAGAINAKMMGLAFTASTVTGMFSTPEEGKEQTKAQKEVQNIGESIAAGASAAMMVAMVPALAPIAPIVGVLAGAFNYATKATKAAVPSTLELTNNNQKLIQSTESQITSLQEAIKSQNEISELKTSGGDPKKIAKAQSTFAKSLGGIKDPELISTILNEKSDLKKQEAIANFQEKKSKDLNFSQGNLVTSEIIKKSREENVSVFGNKTKTSDFKTEDFDTFLNPIIDSIDFTKVKSKEASEAIDKLGNGTLSMGDFITQFGSELGLTESQVKMASKTYGDLNKEFTDSSIQSMDKYAAALLTFNKNLNDTVQTGIQGFSLDFQKVFDEGLKGLTLDTALINYKNFSTAGTNLSIEKSRLDSDRASGRITEAEGINRQASLQTKDLNLDAEKKGTEIVSKAVEQLTALIPKNASIEQRSNILNQASSVLKGGGDLSSLEGLIKQSLGSSDGSKEILSQIADINQEVVLGIEKLRIDQADGLRSINTISQDQLKESQRRNLAEIGKSALAGPPQYTKKLMNTGAVLETDAKIQKLRDKAERSGGGETETGRKLLVEASNLEMQNDRIKYEDEQAQAERYGKDNVVKRTNEERSGKAQLQKTMADDIGQKLRDLNKARAKSNQGSIFSDASIKKITEGIQIGGSGADESKRMLDEKFNNPYFQDSTVQSFAREIKGVGGVNSIFANNNQMAASAGANVPIAASAGAAGAGFPVVPNVAGAGVPTVPSVAGAGVTTVPSVAGASVPTVPSVAGAGVTTVPSSGVAATNTSMNPSSAAMPNYASSTANITAKSLTGRGSEQADILRRSAAVTQTQDYKSFEAEKAKNVQLRQERSVAEAGEPQRIIDNQKAVEKIKTPLNYQRTINTGTAATLKQDFVMDDLVSFQERMKSGKATETDFENLKASTLMDEGGNDRSREEISARNAYISQVESSGFSFKEDEVSVEKRIKEAQAKKDAKAKQGLDTTLEDNQISNLTKRKKDAGRNFEKEIERSDTTLAAKRERIDAAISAAESYNTESSKFLTQDAVLPAKTKSKTPQETDINVKRLQGLEETAKVLGDGKKDDERIQRVEEDLREGRQVQGKDGKIERVKMSPEEVKKAQEQLAGFKSDKAENTAARIKNKSETARVKAGLAEDPVQYLKSLEKQRGTAPLQDAAQIDENIKKNQDYLKNGVMRKGKDGKEQLTPLTPEERKKEEESLKANMAAKKEIDLDNKIKSVTAQAQMADPKGYLELLQSRRGVGPPRDPEELKKGIQAKKDEIKSLEKVNPLSADEANQFTSLEKETTAYDKSVSNIKELEALNKIPNLSEQSQKRKAELEATSSADMELTSYSDFEPWKGVNPKDIRDKKKKLGEFKARLDPKGKIADLRKGIETDEKTLSEDQLIAEAQKKADAKDPAKVRASYVAKLKGSKDKNLQGVAAKIEKLDKKKTELDSLKGKTLTADEKTELTGLEDETRSFDKAESNRKELNILRAKEPYGTLTDSDKKRKEQLELTEATDAKTLDTRKEAKDNKLELQDLRELDRMGPLSEGQIARKTELESREATDTKILADPQDGLDIVKRERMKELQAKAKNTEKETQLRGEVKKGTEDVARATDQNMGAINNELFKGQVAPVIMDQIQKPEDKKKVQAYNAKVVERQDQEAQLDPINKNIADIEAKRRDRSKVGFEAMADMGPDNDGKKSDFINKFIRGEVTAEEADEQTGGALKNAYNKVIPKKEGQTFEDLNNVGNVKDEKSKKAQIEKQIAQTKEEENKLGAVIKPLVDAVTGLTNAQGAATEGAAEGQNAQGAQGVVNTTNVNTTSQISVNITGEGITPEMIEKLKPSIIGMVEQHNREVASAAGKPPPAAPPTKAPPATTG